MWDNLRDYEVKNPKIFLLVENAVSYTHLDVYKRQIKGFLKIHEGHLCTEIKGENTVNIGSASSEAFFRNVTNNSW